MKDLEWLADEILERFYEDPFSEVSVELERIGTRRLIPKDLILQVDRRIVSQLESEIPEEEDWEYLFFLVNETKKWKIVDFHLS